MGSATGSLRLRRENAGVFAARWPRATRSRRVPGSQGWRNAGTVRRSLRMPRFSRGHTPVGSASRRQARSESVASPQVRRVALGTASRNRFAGDGQAEDTLGFSGLSPVGFGPPLRRLGSGLRSRAPRRTTVAGRNNPPGLRDWRQRLRRRRTSQVGTLGLRRGWFGGRVLVTRISWRGSWFPSGSLPRLVGATAAPVPMVPLEGLASRARGSRLGYRRQAAG